jgi:hypothetical protein
MPRVALAMLTDMVAMIDGDIGGTEEAGTCIRANWQWNDGGDD